MAELTIELPKRLLEFAERQVATGEYTDVADYVRALVREEQSSRERFLGEIQKGVDSPDSPLSFDEAWTIGVERARSRAA